MLHNVVVTLPTTNCVIASIMCAVLRGLVEGSDMDANYIMYPHSSPMIQSYRGDEGEYMERLVMEKDPNCICCRETRGVRVSYDRNRTVESLVRSLVVQEGWCRRYSLWHGLTPLYATVIHAFRPYA